MIIAARALHLFFVTTHAACLFNVAYILCLDVITLLYVALLHSNNIIISECICHTNLTTFIFFPHSAGCKTQLHYIPSKIIGEIKFLINQNIVKLNFLYMFFIPFPGKMA